ncbi:MAG: hypothetical protein CMN30_08890 [Sandaracinus sp.]|nr:hypothetical protein [Sandaracinus sp.]|tara:strand:- start:8 stop:1747 length:1740 start_codon:yes stop_codon:yes gene_type:complete
MADEPESTAIRHHRSFRIWLLPLLLLMGVWLAIFLLTFWVDASGAFERLELLWRPNPSSAANTIANAGEVVAAVLGIAITVVAIIVELASNRYTHRITELFVGEPINFFVMGFFVIAALQAIFVGVIFDDTGEAASGFVPYFGITVSMAMLGICLLLLLPYFAFVFDFLNPIQIVDRMRLQTIRAMSRRGIGLAARKAEAVRGVEQLADVGLNAMEHKDKGVSMASVDALQAMVIDYQTVRPRLSKEWFRIDGELAHNPDFVSMSDDVLSAVTRRRIWFEMKVLRKYQTLYNEALNKMRDICYLVAINTRHIAEAAIEVKNAELFALVVKFFNTYLRATVNARDVRTAYNVLHQYRLLAQAVLHHRDGEKAIEIARYFKYYGLVSFNAKLPFILETVAYDLCELNEIAFEEKSPAARELLRIFLQVDKESESEVQEISLRGVRKAQVKLATYYLRHGAEDWAREIFEDMEPERRDRLGSIRDELLNVQSSEFWEISDRGVNFDYLDPERKRELVTFFSWFEDLPRKSYLPEELLQPNAAEAHPARDSRKRDEVLHDVPGGGADPGKEESSDEFALPGAE